MAWPQFGYAMAAAVIQNFTIIGNTIGEDVTFIGSVGPNCSTSDVTPTPEPLVFNSSQVIDSNLQPGFVDKDTDSLTCILPDNGGLGDFIPLGSS